MRRRAALVLVGACLLTAACVAKAPPDPAVMRDTPAPWPAPRDGISYIDAAGLPHLPFNTTDAQRIVTVSVTVDGTRVEIPPYVGVDRVRAIQAPVHTHDASGRVWLEGEGSDQVTLGQFFTVWGVRFTPTCVGSTCGSVRVTADGERVEDPVGLRLAGVQSRVVVVATAR